MGDGDLQQQRGTESRIRRQQANGGGQACDTTLLQSLCLEGATPVDTMPPPSTHPGRPPHPFKRPSQTYRMALPCRVALPCRMALLCRAAVLCRAACVGLRGLPHLTRGARPARVPALEMLFSRRTCGVVRLQGGVAVGKGRYCSVFTVATRRVAPHSRHAHPSAAVRAGLATRRSTLDTPHTMGSSPRSQGCCSSSAAVARLDGSSSSMGNRKSRRPAACGRGAVAWRTTWVGREQAARRSAGRRPTAGGKA